MMPLLGSFRHRNVFFVFFMFLFFGGVSAQTKTYDTSYIADYHNELITRVFGSRKYTTYGLSDKNYQEKINYKPNSPFNVGFGFNYKAIGLNIGFNIPLINQTKLYGKTRFLDLQSHIYGRKLIVDFYLQRYKGFYVPNADAIMSNQLIYRRPDLKVFNMGLEFQYLLNWKKFTFRGAFLQNEIQRKSAGSPIIGTYVGMTSIQADSNVIPQNLIYNDFYNNFNFLTSFIKSVNFNVGYGYTLVLPLNLFITTAITGGLGLNFSELKSNNQSATSKIGSNIGGTFRIGLGYNSRRFFTGIHYAGARSSHNTPIQFARQEFGAGNFRISIAHRFTLKKRLLGFY
jgi:hypothetical protein